MQTKSRSPIWSRVQLPGVQLEGPDAADALAIAICHYHQAGRTLASVMARVRA